MKAKKIERNTEHENIYRRISEISKALQHTVRILEEDKGISTCGRKRLEDIRREIY